MALRTALLADSPISYWQMVAGSGTDEKGINAGTPTALTTGAALFPGTNGSSVFDGATSKMAMGTPATLKPAFPMSVVACYKTSNTGSMRILRWRDYGYWLHIGDAGGINEFAFQDAGAVIHNARWTNVGGDVADNLPHMLHGTYDGANVKFYLDSVLKATLPATQAINYTDNGFAIGVNGDDPTLWFTGSISDVAVFGSALTQTQITNHWVAATSLTSTEGLAFRNDVNRPFGPF